MRYDIEAGNGFNLMRALKYSAIAGWELGALLCSVFVPFLLWIIGERDIANYGEHALSLGALGLWVFGFGLATFIVHGFALFSIGTSNDKHKMTVLVLYVAHFVFVTVVVSIGAVRRDIVDRYGQEMWDGAKPQTIDLLQNYFHCCGFSDDDKPGVYFCDDGLSGAGLCGDQFRRITLSQEGNSRVRVNTPLLLTFLLLSLLLIYDLWMLALVALWIRDSPPDHPSSSSSSSSPRGGSIDLELPRGTNKSSIYTISRSNSTVSTCVTNTTSASAHGAKYEQDSNRSYPASSSSESTSAGSNPSLAAKDESSSSGEESKTTTFVARLGGLFGRVGHVVSSSMQRVFQWLGVRVAENPKIFITLSIVIGLTMTGGILQQRKVGRGADLLLPEDSQLRKNLESVARHFPAWVRENSMIVVQDTADILSTEVIQAMAELDQKIVTMETGEGERYPAVCFPLDGDRCLRSNLFELWRFNRTVTRHLTREQVLDELNRSPPLYSPHTNIPFAVASVIGDLQYDASSGNITDGSAHLMRYFTPRPLDWELQFIEVGLGGFPGVDQVYVKSAQSEDIEFDKTFYSDVPLLMVGGCLIFVYVLFMSGNWSLVGHRFWIAVASIASIGLSLGLTIGLSAALLYPWTQLGLLAPFLLLGIGVDDMFVILRTWDNVSGQDSSSDKSLTEKAGVVLRLAGASITVTSMTDLIAFCIGISSTIPFLSSFCVTLSIGVITLFIMQVTFFFPALVIDERRKLMKHDGLLLGCYPHKNEYKENKYADMQLQKRFFKSVLSYITSNSIVKAVVLVVTLAMASAMCYGVTRLNYNYDEEWFIDSESYLSDYYKAFNRYFKEDKTLTSINVVGGDFYSNRLQMEELKQQVEANEYIANGSCYGWFDEYAASSYAMGQDYRNDSTFDNIPINYYISVQQFIAEKPIFAKDIEFKPLSMEISASRFTCKQVPVDIQSDALPGMQSLRQLCADIKWPNGTVFPVSEDYISLESILIVKKEIVTNLALTFTAVTVVILFLISSIQTCFWVILSVFLTILDVGGVMYYWGLTIEAGTMVCLILAIGLAVDYSSHIGYKFMIYSGDRSERATAALVNIGPAVFNGGFSTFLPIVMLAGSNIYVTMTFFKIFFSVVWFGLWHSLIFLPVVLSLIGPAPYKSATLPPK